MKEEQKKRIHEKYRAALNAQKIGARIPISFFREDSVSTDRPLAYGANKAAATLR